jgi:hypothetical protein
LLFENLAIPQRAIRLASLDAESELVRTKQENNEHEERSGAKQPRGRRDDLGGAPRMIGIEHGLREQGQDDYAGREQRGASAAQLTDVAPRPRSSLTWRLGRAAH